MDQKQLSADTAIIQGQYTHLTKEDIHELMQRTAKDNIMNMFKHLSEDEVDLLLAQADVIKSKRAARKGAAGIHVGKTPEQIQAMKDKAAATRKANKIAAADKKKFETGKPGA